MGDKLYLWFLGAPARRSQRPQPARAATTRKRWRERSGQRSSRRGTIGTSGCKKPGAIGNSHLAPAVTGEIRPRRRRLCNFVSKWWRWLSSRGYCRVARLWRPSGPPWSVYSPVWPTMPRRTGLLRSKPLPRPVGVLLVLTFGGGLLYWDAGERRASHGRDTCPLCLGVGSLELEPETGCCPARGSSGAST